MSASKWKPYPEYKDSNVNGLGKIPYHWSVERIATLGRISKGSGGSKEDNVDSGLPCIRYGDLYTHHNFVVKDFKTQISAESASRYTTLEKGDILFAASGESIDEIGKSVLFNLDETAYCGGDNIICKTGGTDDSDFLGFATNAPYFAAQKSMVGRGFTVLHIYGTQLRDLRLALPPLDERKAISKFISQTKNLLDSQISILENLLPLLEEKRLVLITQAVTKGLNPDVSMKDTGLHWYPEVPSHWNLRKVKHIASIRPSNVDKKKYEGQDKVRLANYVDVYKNDRITEDMDLMVATASENEIIKFSLLAGDMIITKDSETWNDIAVPAFVPATMEGVVCGYHLTLIRPNQQHVRGEFLFRTYQALGVRDQYHYNANGVTRYGLGSYWVNNGIVPVPPLHEQVEIAEYIDRNLQTMKSIEDNIQSKIGKLKEYRTALISAAVTGKIDVGSL